MLNLGHILEALTDYRTTGAEPAITAVVIDSREATPGSLFVAFAGERQNGHNYVHDAFNRGAIAALVAERVETDEADWCQTIDARDGHAEAPSAPSGVVPDVHALPPDPSAPLPPAPEGDRHA